MTSDFLRTRFGAVREVPQKIFELWAERLRTYYTQILPEGMALPEKFLLKKAAVFLHPYYLLGSSPFELPDMHAAVGILREMYAAQQKQKLILFADRDADGVTSVSILYSFLTEKLGFPKELTKVMLPHDHEKYGVNDEVAERIIAENPDVLIALDNGSSNKTELEYIAQKTGCQIMVFDHHFLPQNETDYPKIAAFVNPKRLSVLSPERDLCTAGLALKLIQALSYSFTSEFNRCYTLESANQPACFCNGSVIDRSLASQTPALIEERTLNQWWEKESNNSREIAELSRFDKNHPGTFELADKFRVLQNLQLKKIREVSEYFFPLAAAGIVADIMPLIDDNRIMLSEGLAVLNKREAAYPRGMKELLRVMKVNLPVTEQDFAFSVCPAINAAGRMGNAMFAFETLVETDALTAAQKAFDLVKINEDRKKITKDSLDLLDSSLLTDPQKSQVVVAHHQNFHKGISGPLAGKLADKFRKPAIVLVRDGDILKGSARSFANENIFSLLQSVSEIFIQFGGHRQAAGFSLVAEKIHEFTQLIEQKIPDWQKENEMNNSPEEIFRTFYPPLKIDKNLLRSSLWNDLLLLAPYGAMNPHPVLEFSPSGEMKVQLMGKEKNHARVNFADINDPQVEGVWFFHNGDTEMIESEGTKIFTAEPHISRFLGKTRYQLKIKKLDISEMS